MKVKAIHALQGPGETIAPGAVVDLETEEARRLLAIGAVEAVEVPESKPDSKKSGKQPQAN